MLPKAESRVISAAIDAAIIDGEARMSAYDDNDPQSPNLVQMHAIPVKVTTKAPEIRQRCAQMQVPPLLPQAEAVAGVPVLPSAITSPAPPSTVSRAHPMPSPRHGHNVITMPKRTSVRHLPPA